MSRILQAHRVAAPLSSPEAEGLQVCGDENECGKDANYPSRVSPSPFQQERVDLGLGCSSLPIPATPQIPTATEVQLTRPMEDRRSISPLPKAVCLSCTFTASQTIAATATGSKTDKVGSSSSLSRVSLYHVLVSMGCWVTNEKRKWISSVCQNYNLADNWLYLHLYLCYISWPYCSTGEFRFWRLTIEDSPTLPKLLLLVQCKCSHFNNHQSLSSGSLTSPFTKMGLLSVSVQWISPVNDSHQVRRACSRMLLLHCPGWGGRLASKHALWCDPQNYWLPEILDFHSGLGSQHGCCSSQPCSGFDSCQCQPPRSRVPL